MPRGSTTNSNTQAAREYARDHKLAVDVSYHLFVVAITADGRQPRLAREGLMVAEADLSTEDKAALAAAKAALGL